MGDLGLYFSRGWDESIDRKKGYFETSWGAPSTWDDVILQGPHLHVATPLYKSPNESMLHNQDWSLTDFELLAADAIPVTAYKPMLPRYRYDSAYTHWGDDHDPKPARDYYRVAWRAMANNTSERTLTPAIIPPGVAHVHGVASLGRPDLEARSLGLIAAYMGSMLVDFSVRTAPKSTIPPATINRLAFSQPTLANEMLLRTLRLNCVTDAYAELWTSSWDAAFIRDSWRFDFPRPLRAALGDVSEQWSTRTPLRVATDRRQAQVELEALVALTLGLTAEELCTIYRTQFAVLYGYDRNVYFYDANGRLVPNSVLTVWRNKGDRISADERTATNQTGITYVYELPFMTLDREADMRAAYVQFQQVLVERS